MLKEQPSGLKRSYHKQTDTLVQNNPRVPVRLDYLSLFRKHRWADNQCGNKSFFNLKNVQMIVGYLASNSTR
jgi:hypothetical protein